MEPKEAFRIVRWRENPHLDVVCVNLMEATKYVEEYNRLAGKQECYVDEDIWHPLSYHETINLQEQITILTEQRDGYKDQLTEMKRLFDSSQEEVKRLKEHAELDKSAIIQYQAQVKELTELVKEAWEAGREYGIDISTTEGTYRITTPILEEWLKSKGL